MATVWPSCKVGLFWSCRLEISFVSTQFFLLKLQTINGEDSRVIDYKMEKRGHVMKTGSGGKNAKVDTPAMVRMGYRDKRKR